MTGRVSSKAALAGLAVAVAVLSIASPAATAVQPVAVAPYYLARGDPRACPSPICGGLFTHLVNRSRTTCGDGFRHPTCYVASVDLGNLGVSESTRLRLMGLISAGRALVRGRLVRGGIQGFPELDTLVAREVWKASSSPNPSAGTFRRLRDNGVRCVAAPCFSTDALKINPKLAGAQVKVSQIELGGTDATEGEQRRALRSIARGDLIASGTMVIVPRAGPAGRGVAFVASQLYTRAA